MKNLFRVAASIAAFVALLITSPVVNAAQYPPVISLPLPGEPIQAPVSPSSTNYVVKIPVSTAKEAPKVEISDSVTYKSAGFAAGKPISPKSLAANPVRLNSGMYFGGVSTSTLSLTPIATINRSYNEVQTSVDVPTRVTVSGLPANTSAVIRYYTTSGAARDLGTIKTNKSGALTLPPITLSKVGQVLTVQISAGKVTRILLVRATR